jgi:hypothetical protein
MTVSDHTTARKVAGLIIEIGWISVALGALAAVLGLEMAVVSTSTFGFGLTAIGTGLLDVAVGYGLRAVLDMADNTSAILAELRRSGRLSPATGSVSPREPEPAAPVSHRANSVRPAVWNSRGRLLHPPGSEPDPGGAAPGRGLSS